jgi:hypothetical protein
VAKLDAARYDDEELLEEDLGREAQGKPALWPEAEAGPPTEWCTFRISSIQRGRRRVIRSSTC